MQIISYISSHSSVLKQWFSQLCSHYAREYTDSVAFLTIRCDHITKIKFYYVPSLLGREPKVRLFPPNIPCYFRMVVAQREEKCHKTPCHFVDLNLVTIDHWLGHSLYGSAFRWECSPETSQPLICEGPSTDQFFQVQLQKEELGSFTFLPPLVLFFSLLCNHYLKIHLLSHQNSSPMQMSPQFAFLSVTLLQRTSFNYLLRILLSCLLELKLKITKQIKQQPSLPLSPGIQYFAFLRTHFKSLNNQD